MIRDILYSFRPKQWTKNLFIFSALIFDRQLTNSKSLITTLAGFLIFCALSSSVYLFNDLFDIEADKSHPTKKNRPIASGRLNKRLAVVIAIFLGIGALCFAFLLSWGFFLICSSYLLINLLYSKWLKHLAGNRCFNCRIRICVARRSRCYARRGGKILPMVVRRHNLVGVVHRLWKAPRRISAPGWFCESTPHCF